MQAIFAAAARIRAFAELVRTSKLGGPQQWAGS